jgi:leucyl aminopeptidase (aminopeptidase T)
MLIQKTLTPPQQIREITTAEFNLAKRNLKTNLLLKPDDSVLIVTDERFFEQEAAIWFEAAKELTNSVELLVISGMNTSGQEPPPAVIDKCRQADVVILHTYYSLTHTQAGQAGTENGGRVASLPSVDYEMMLRTLTGDYTEINLLGEKIKSVLATGSKIKITSAAGTNLTSQIRSNNVVNDGGFMQAGEIGNLPAGEVFFSPIEKTTTGTWVINGSLADDELLEPIKLTIESGRVVKIDGDKVATRLQNKLSKIGDQAFEIAELGIGTNPDANPKGSIIEAEKAYGTAHLAIGNNFFMGGSNNVPIHLDGLTLNPTITVDGKIILENGKFV